MPQITKKEREGEIHINNQGCLMKIIKYNSFKDVDVEFQDEYKAIINSQYHHITDGTTQNPYYPTVYGVGIVGEKYQSHIGQRATKEYSAWKGIIQRSFDKEYKNEKSTYKNVTCCKEWLLFENFYEWIHNQSNFDKWLNNKNWHVDKDILKKGNKIYSPQTCCLVSQRVNALFIKDNAKRGSLPIGVTKSQHRYTSQCRDAENNKTKYNGSYDTVEEAFEAYKKYKENVIKIVAQEEYDNGNITEECYRAMMLYSVEITD